MYILKSRDMIGTSLDKPMPVNDERKQWHEWPAIVQSNLKSILVFVKHPLVSRKLLMNSSGEHNRLFLTFLRKTLDKQDSRLIWCYFPFLQQHEPYHDLKNIKYPIWTKNTLIFGLICKGLSLRLYILVNNGVFRFYFS